jgi:hypothetical protein
MNHISSTHSFLNSQQDHGSRSLKFFGHENGSLADLTSHYSEQDRKACSLAFFGHDSLKLMSEKYTAWTLEPLLPPTK